MSLITSLQKGTTLTTNGMPANTSTANPCLDLFGSIAAARNWNEADIIALFSSAMEFDSKTTIRILFWARDIRQGAGERRVFKICLKFLDENYKEYVNKNLGVIPFYGRWDDMFHLDNDLMFYYIKQGLENNDGLLGKWLPRKGTFANEVRKFLRFTPKEYRKTIVGLSKTVEQDMCSKNWEEIKYEHVPSQAMHKYKTAFYRNDEPRFTKYIEDVTTGTTKINAGTLYPYQLYDAIKNVDYKKDIVKKTVLAQWDSLPNYMEGSKERILPVCDVSGSMDILHSNNVSPMSVSVSLGLYISERNEGPFKDAFITFSNNPKLQYLKGNLFDRCLQLRKADWKMNTDIAAVFNMLLGVAVRDNLPEEEMPTKLLIISDMQFDRCTKNSDLNAFEIAREYYKKAGYTLPDIVFWNVNAVVNNFPVFKSDTGTALISGCSPSILKSVLLGKNLNPVQVMMDTVYSERYDNVCDTI